MREHVTLMDGCACGAAFGPGESHHDHVAQVVYRAGYRKVVS